MTPTLVYPSLYFSGSSPSLSRMDFAITRSRLSLSNFRVPSGIFIASRTPLTFRMPYLGWIRVACQGYFRIQGGKKSQIGSRTKMTTVGENWLSVWNEYVLSVIYETVENCVEPSSSRCFFFKCVQKNYPYYLKANYLRYCKSIGPK